jgi:DNA-binding response OmpR family regulator
MTNGSPPILVVDHERDRREAIQVLLEKAGHKVSVAEDGNQALKMANEVKPDIALIGMGLPGLPSDALAQGLRKNAEGRKMHLIAITPQRHDRERVGSSGFDLHVATPTLPDTLLGIIANIRRVDETAA